MAMGSTDTSVASHHFRGGGKRNVGSAEHFCNAPKISYIGSGRPTALLLHSPAALSPVKTDPLQNHIYSSKHPSISGSDLGDRQLIIGVIGGLGPSATMDFCNRVIRCTPVEREQDHLHLIVDNNPKTPNRNQALEGTGPSAERWLVESARRLDGAGADFLVMPCNTAHAYADAIIESTTVPFVSIIDETVEWIQKWSNKQSASSAKIGLLAADGCLRAGLYQDKVESLGLGLIRLSPSIQEDFMQLVYEIKKQGVHGGLCDRMKTMAENLIAQGVQCIIAGCTEVPLTLAPEHVSVPLIDSTEILASRCVAYAMRREILPGTPSTAEIKHVGT